MKIHSKENDMEFNELARQLLIAPHLIACIHEEDIKSKFGITVLYNDGASFSKPFTTKEERLEVWKRLLKIRPNSFTQFGDVLFEPKDVKQVKIIAGENGEAVLIIEFTNHAMHNDLFFHSSQYNNFARSCMELYDHLEACQFSRSNYYVENDPPQ